MGLDFVDLTVEPPMATVERIDAKAVRGALAEYGMSVVGHTAYYLPIASPFEEIRQAAVRGMTKCLRLFAQIGATWMNVHPDARVPLHDRSFYVQRNLQSLSELLDESTRVGVGIMLENIPPFFNDVAQLKDLLDPLPKLGLHLDIGHCNLDVTHNSSGELIERYYSRIRHVHLHDNRGGSADLHLPLGTGSLDWVRWVRTLQAAGYDGTITLEVFSKDTHYLQYNRDLLRRVWDETAKIRPGAAAKISESHAAAGDGPPA